ncbi:hypothetical protein FB451DRAFT_1192313 [Mycena latifolia]|nr:hypothetical protein FB451DRAFT_1192313 [Mycena latifolia]
MSASASAFKSQNREQSPFRLPKSSHSESSSPDWLPALLFNAKAIYAGAESLPFPYVKGVFATAIFLLETVEKVQKNRDQMKELCADTVDIITVLRGQIWNHRDTAHLQFKVQCDELEAFLQDVVEAVHIWQTLARGFSARIKEFMKSSSASDEISRFRNRIREVRSNFMLMATVDTNFRVQKVLSVVSPSTHASMLDPPVNTCPPPTRIFHGRRRILDEMNHYFTQDKQGNQDIFLLHGLGGAGKTQIALKFIQESASQFTNIFLIDASTVETIDAGLKNIATTKSIGRSSNDALQWLKSKQEDWLLFFDNADDPKINLNNYFPECIHGNILITSRNPGLCVYAGAHCAVSDMEEKDAVDLLLRSAAQNTTDGNKGTAVQIVKSSQLLCYPPLAIIQAGAFISKSGNLNSYLAVYAQSRAQLLSQKPDQTHDNYAWTVYTTWQISFDQLSQRAKRFLCLCSCLHYQGISEHIFKNATNNKFRPSDPSKEELEMPLKILSQFLGPSGVWDPLCFMDATNEIRAYSLINFDSEKGMFSIHPLVHDWTRTTLSEEIYHQCMLTITGMALTVLSVQDMPLASLWMLPHIDFLMKGDSNVLPDFRLEFGKVYMFAGKPEKAAEIELLVIEKRKVLLGEDHPNTLEAMYWLALAYGRLGKWKDAEEISRVVLKKRTPSKQWVSWQAYTATQENCKEAEELEVMLLAKCRNFLGDNHVDTLTTMANLATTSHRLGKLKEAEDLGAQVLEKRKIALGDNHPETLFYMGNLAQAYYSCGKLREAGDLEVLVLEKYRNILGNNHWETLRAMGNLAGIYAMQGKLEEAEVLELTVLEKRRHILGDTHPETLLVMGNVAFTLMRTSAPLAWDPEFATAGLRPEFPTFDSISLFGFQTCSWLN